MNGDLATLLPANNEKRGQDIPVDVLNPCFALTRDLAARLNGRANASDARVAGVGVGALGSQIVMNLARSGFGRWTLIDADRLMPHNVARHALDGRFVGMNKAEAVAYSAGTATFEDSGFQGLDADLLGWKSEEAEEALSSADVIVDHDGVRRRTTTPCQGDGFSSPAYLCILKSIWNGLGCLGRG